MERIRKIIYTILCIVAVIVAVGSLLSVFRNTESRFLKMLDFPRIQFFFTSLISLVLFLILTKRWQWWDYLLVVCLVGGILTHSFYLINYTPLTAKKVATAEKGTYSEEDRISILLTNVEMSNRQAQPLLDLIEAKNPDLIIAMEVDKWWDEQLRPIEDEYSYIQETINSVAYGMALYSKFPLENPKVNYLNNEKVPSFESVIQLKNGKSFALYAMHPPPPTHYKDLPDNAGKKEAAMTKLGTRIKNIKMPIIVAGDLNDVVWSFTNELTSTKDLLFDVRVGRGFYNSYNANHFFLRWPIDHVFVSKEFRLVSIERLPDIESDHFPIFVELVL